MSRRSLGASTGVHLGLLVLLAPLSGTPPVRGEAPRQRSVQIVRRPALEIVVPPFEEVEPSPREDQPPEEQLDVEPREEEPEEEVRPAPLRPRPVPIPGHHELLDDRAVAELVVRPADVSEPVEPPSPEPVAAPREPHPVALAAPPAEPPGESEPLLLEAPPPPYPGLARRMQWEGSVLCLLRVDDRGRVVEVAVRTSSGHEVLDEAAVEAVRRWRFRPGLRAGRADAFEVLHRVTFQLPG